MLKSSNGRKTYAADGIVRFTVSFPGNERTGATRQEIIGIRGKGALIGDQDKLVKALAQFRKALRFVIVNSGESLERLLAGKFREILHTVIQETMKSEFEQAERRRAGYVEELQGTLLDPLRDRIASVLTGLFPEITAVELVPTVPSIDHTLSNVTVNLDDAVITSLAAKGTGVRAGVLVAMMRYLADQSKRSIVFAIEEPETFLHPAAQEDLRDDLEKLAERPGVSLMVTTHSPFIPSRNAKAQVIAVAKDAEGRTREVGRARGDEPHAGVVGGLFRDAVLGDMIERAANVPFGTRAVVFLEGTTDVDYLVLCARKAKRPDLLAGLHLVATGGAGKLLAEAVLMRAQTVLPVLAVLDSDEPGRKAADALVTRCSFSKKRDIVSYAELWPGRPADVEAEDLFPNALLERFLEQEGDQTVMAEKVWRTELDAWHYGFNATGKDLLPGFLRGDATVGDVARWLELLELIRSRAGLDGAA